VPPRNVYEFAPDWQFIIHSVNSFSSTAGADMEQDEIFDERVPKEVE
jgi:hypothetical protein